MNLHEIFDNVYPAPLYMAAIKNTDPGMFINRTLFKLKEYDRENQTDYFETLRVYSLNINNKEATSQTLGIHRNTLLYRLDRITSIFGIPYEEPRTALALQASFQLCDLWDEVHPRHF